LVGGPPGVELHTIVDELPSGDTGDIVPVVLPTNVVGMVPNGIAGIIAVGRVVAIDDVIVVVVPGVDVETVLCLVDDVGTEGTEMEGNGRGGTGGGCGAGIVAPGKTPANVVSGCWENVNGATALPVVGEEELGDGAEIVGAAETDSIVPVVPTVTDMEATGTGGAPGAICPVGVEQVTTVPGAVGSEASGTGASVVSGVPGWVVAENGLGPLSGEVTIAPGVDARPMAVVPMVETCAEQALQPASRVATVNSKRCIALLRADLAGLRLACRDLAAFRQIDHRIENN
jgi:hypothetical protein